MRYFLLIMVVAALLSGCEDPAYEAQKELDLYCDMVYLNKTNPDLGWPDYKGIYDGVCQ